LAPGTPPDLWCLERPEEVARVHRSYAAAGAEAAHTNTFGATTQRLADFGLAAKAAEIVAAAVRLAREAVPASGFVLGSIGPAGTGSAGVGRATSDYVALAEQLLDAGVDALVLETVFSVDEGEAALTALRRLTTRPIVLSFTFARKGGRWVTPGCGTDVETTGRRAAAAGADALGANCCEGAAGLDQVVEALARVAARRPVLVRPSAGLPAGGRWPETPASHGEAARRFLRLGASAVGACCGATPAHVAAVAAALSKQR
jgi:5-methyltetrahydrofolate--homocysteine methyltransferase